MTQLDRSTRLLLLLSASLVMIAARGQAQDSPQAADATEDIDAQSTEQAPPEPPQFHVPEASPEPLRVELRNAEGLDSEELGRALERDLGGPIEWVEPQAQAPSRPGPLVIIERTDRGTLLIRVRRPEQDTLERETVTSQDTYQATLAAALLIANLVRDESGELLRMLQPPQSATVDTTDLDPTPVQPPRSAIEAPAPTPPVAVEAPREHIPFGIDFFPGLGMSSAYLAGEQRHFSIGILGDLTGAIEGVSLSSVLSINTGELSGVQASAVLAYSDRISSGLQLGSVLSITATDVEGAQLGVIDIAGGSVEGAQLGVLELVGSDLHGAQLGVVNVVGNETNGVQMGVLNVSGGDVAGLQMGVLNISGGRVDGVQVGLVNISADADAAIGLVNIHTQGRTQLRFGVDSNLMLGSELVHGGKLTHTILSLSAQPFVTHALVGLGIGFGARAELSEDFRLDLDAITHVLIDEETLDNTSGNRGSPDLLIEARALLGYRVLEGFGIYAGVAYRLHLSRSAEPSLGTPFGETDFGTRRAADDYMTRGWPALIAGVQLF